MAAVVNARILEAAAVLLQVQGKKRHEGDARPEMQPRLPDAERADRERKGGEHRAVLQDAGGALRIAPRRFGHERADGRAEGADACGLDPAEHAPGGFRRPFDGTTCRAGRLLFVRGRSGPSLIFITLPNIFANMSMGRLWGSLFFLFMAFAALSTVLAVFENIICCGMELTGCSRKKSSLVNFVLITLLSLPCVLGYNVWAWDGFAVFGGAVLDLEDFLVSNLFLPLGSLVYLLFCVTKYGWGWDNYKKEVNTGKGLKMHDWMRGYLTCVLPVIVLFIFAFGLYDKFL